MNIETTTGYKVGDQVFATMLEAQAAAIEAILTKSSQPCTDARTCTLAIIEGRDAIREVLAMKAKLKPGRKPGSGRKPRKPAAVKDGPIVG